MIQVNLEEIAAEQFYAYRSFLRIPEHLRIAQPRRTFMINRGRAYGFDELISELEDENLRLVRLWFAGHYTGQHQTPNDLELHWAQYKKGLTAEAGRRSNFIVTLNRVKRSLKGKPAHFSDNLQFKKEDGKWSLEYCRILATNFQHYDLQFGNFLNGPMITRSDEPDNMQACREIAAVLPLQVATLATKLYS